MAVDLFQRILIKGTAAGQSGEDQSFITQNPEGDPEVSGALQKIETTSKTVVAEQERLDKLTVRVDDLAAAATSTQTGSDSTATSGSYRQLIASATNAVKWIHLTGNILGPSVSDIVTIVIATGAAAAEVIIGTVTRRAALSTLDDAHGYDFDLHMEIELVAGTRLSWRPSFNGTVTLIAVSYTVGERA